MNIVNLLMDCFLNGVHEEKQRRFIETEECLFDVDLYENEEKLMPPQTKKYLEEIYELAGNRDINILEEKGDDDFSFALPGISRFRVSSYKQRGALSAVVRIITFDLPQPELIGIPQQIIDFSKLSKGLVLITGPAGSGKSTTLACIINEINKTQEKHIITLEDPIEFLHRHQKSIVSQREVKVDTKKELTEDETKSAKYKALMGLAHEDLPFEDRLDYFKQAMAVAEEMIVDRENTTNFWNNESARPYMIASQDLATLLINNKNYKEAREILELLIKMDEDDTQGNRFKLINLLIAKNDRKAVNDLFARFKNEDSAQWDYFKALYYFKNGNLYFAKSAIKDGVNKNKYIGLFLMQWTAALRMSGSVIDPVLYTEATYYYNENFALWKSTKGALKWLVNAVVK